MLALELVSARQTGGRSVPERRAIGAVGIAPNGVAVAALLAWWGADDAAGTA